jgi:hypothetical protein
VVIVDEMKRAAEMTSLDEMELIVDLYNANYLGLRMMSQVLLKMSLAEPFEAGAKVENIRPSG